MFKEIDCADIQWADLKKINRSDFVFNEARVQGALIGKHKKDGRILYIDSPRRFKLFSDGLNILVIESGGGTVKWKKGETQVFAGKVYRAEDIGEFEINGDCRFIFVKSGD